MKMLLHELAKGVMRPHLLINDEKGIRKALGCPGDEGPGTLWLQIGQHSLGQEQSGCGCIKSGAGQGLVQLLELSQVQAQDAVVQALKAQRPRGVPALERPS